MATDKTAKWRVVSGKARAQELRPKKEAKKALKTARGEKVRAAIEKAQTRPFKSDRGKQHRVLTSLERFCNKVVPEFEGAGGRRRDCAVVAVVLIELGELDSNSNDREGEGKGEGVWLPPDLLMSIVSRLCVPQKCSACWTQMKSVSSASALGRRLTAGWPPGHHPRQCRFCNRRFRSRDTLKWFLCGTCDYLYCPKCEAQLRGDDLFAYHNDTDSDIVGINIDDIVSIRSSSLDPKNLLSKSIDFVTHGTEYSISRVVVGLATMERLLTLGWYMLHGDGSGSESYDYEWLTDFLFGPLPMRILLSFCVDDDEHDHHDHPHPPLELQSAATSMFRSYGRVLRCILSSRTPTARRLKEREWTNSNSDDERMTNFNIWRTLAKMLDHGDVDVVAHACWAFHHLTCNDSSSDDSGTSEEDRIDDHHIIERNIQTMALDLEGVLPRIVELLTRCDDETGGSTTTTTTQQLPALKVLGNVMYHNANAIAIAGGGGGGNIHQRVADIAIFDCDCLQHFPALLRSPCREVRSAAVWTASCVAAGRTQAQVEALVKSGTLKELAEMMKTETDRTSGEPEPRRRRNIHFSSSLKDVRGRIICLVKNMVTNTPFAADTFIMDYMVKEIDMLSGLSRQLMMEHDWMDSDDTSDVHVLSRLVDTLFIMCTCRRPPRSEVEVEKVLENENGNQRRRRREEYPALCRGGSESNILGMSRCPQGHTLTNTPNKKTKKERVCSICLYNSSDDAIIDDTSSFPRSTTHPKKSVRDSSPSPISNPNPNLKGWQGCHQCGDDDFVLCPECAGLDVDSTRFPPLALRPEYIAEIKSSGIYELLQRLLLNESKRETFISSDQYIRWSGLHVSHQPPQDPRWYTWADFGCSNAKEFIKAKKILRTRISKLLSLMKESYISLTESEANCRTTGMWSQGIWYPFSERYWTGIEWQYSWKYSRT